MKTASREMEVAARDIEQFAKVLLRALETQQLETARRMAYRVCITAGNIHLSLPPKNPL